MSARRHIGTGWIIVLMLAAAGGQNHGPTPLPVGAATVAEVKGAVEVHSPQGGAIAAQRGTLLSPESKIETAKGSVLLDLEDGSQVLVKPNSHVVLKAPNQDKGYWLELLLGKINAKVQKRLGNAPSFRMGTPTAVITVRGTRFSVDVDKNQHTRVEVYEGLVEVAGFLPGAPAVLVRPGFATGVEPDRPPEQPRGIENHEMENHWNPGGAPGGHGEDDRDQPERPSTHPNPTDSGSPEHSEEPD